MWTLVLYILTSLLLAWALIRRPQMLTVMLANVFVLAVTAAQSYSGDVLRSIFMGIDGFAVIFAWLFWKRYDSSRAAIVAMLGMVKISFGIASASIGISDIVWASGNNALFISQVLVAGGFANGFMAWLGRSPDRTNARSRGVLGYLERLP